MRLKHLAATAAALLPLAFATAAQAGFEVYHYEGSRDAVRHQCVGYGAVLTERADYSMCVYETRVSTRTCDDNGDCIGTGYDIPSSVRPVMVDDMATGSTGAMPVTGPLPFDSGHAAGLQVHAVRP